MNGMDSICELLINAVKHNELKVLTSSTQNGKWSSIRAVASLIMDVEPSANREILTRSVIKYKHGKPVVLPNG